jgi:hypothetical protein
MYLLINMYVGHWRQLHTWTIYIITIYSILCIMRMNWMKLILKFSTVFIIFEKPFIFFINIYFVC